MNKIKFIAYFCFFYALVHLVPTILLIVKTGQVNLEGLIDVVIWIYVGYIVMKRREKWVYWITVAFLIALVLRGLIGFIFILSSEEIATISTSSLLPLFVSILIFVFSTISLVYIAQKDMRKLFTK